MYNENRELIKKLIDKPSSTFKEHKKLSINKAAFNSELDLCRAEGVLSNRMIKYMKHVIEVAVHNTLFNKKYKDNSVIESEVFNHLEKAWTNYSIGKADGLTYIRLIIDREIDKSDSLRTLNSRRASTFQILSHLPKNISLVSINPKYRSSEQTIQCLHQDQNFDTEEFLTKIGKILTKALQTTVVPTRKSKVVKTPITTKPVRATVTKTTGVTAKEIKLNNNKIVDDFIEKKFVIVTKSEVIKPASKKASTKKK